jgi:endonuclease YncB( thermonuclease family)
LLFALLVVAELGFAAGGARAETLIGEVVGVADGDTVTIVDADHHQHKVRLAGIDAPEKKQPFGNRSRQALAQLVFRQEVTVEWHKKDRYQRLVGLVRVGGLDAGLEQVRAGLAWHYLAYAKEQSATDRHRYSQAEADAKSTNRGLWSDHASEAPWEYRARTRTPPPGARRLNGQAFGDTELRQHRRTMDSREEFIF